MGWKARENVEKQPCASAPSRPAPGRGAQGMLLAVLILCATAACTPSNRTNTRGGSANGEAQPPVASPDVGEVAVEQPPKYEGPVWFDTVADCGVDFVHQTGTNEKRPFPATNGSGVASLDYDGDGLQDLYFLTGQPLPAKPTAETPRNQFYRNLGEWRFENISSYAGLDLSAFSAGVAAGDFNCDGFQDVYVACIGKNVLYENMGDGTFRAVPESAGTTAHGFAASTAMFDYNRDGFPDIYVCNYGAWNPEKLFNRPCGNVDRPHYCSPEEIEPGFDILLENDGQGGWRDVTEATGLREVRGRAQGVIATDLNDDGLIDIYTANDLDPNFLFLNTLEGVFQDATHDSGLGFSGKGVKQAGMGVDAGDINGDKRIDVVVTNFEADYNTIYIAGEAFFTDQTNRLGVVAQSMPHVAWGVTFTDFNLDGWSDMVLTNGHVDDNRPGKSYGQPPLAWENKQGRFDFLGPKAGPHFQGAKPGRAMVVTDLDNDGDADLVFGHQDDTPALLRNNRIQEGSAPASVVLRLIGRKSNRDAVGADILVTSGEKSQRHQVKAGGSYMSSSDARVLLAVESEADVQIRWPGGFTSKLSALQAGRIYAVIEPDDRESDAAVHEIY